MVEKDNNNYVVKTTRNNTKGRGGHGKLSKTFLVEGHSALTSPTKPGIHHAETIF